ncbi:hypothetical protein [Streptomyces goshikiensis]|uniref:hypothetical protein n=1 Tax=Streptomyces goshikiensis TaxID=1942 RepID=UPI0036609CAB
MPFAIALLLLLIEFTPAHVGCTVPLLVATPALAAVTMGPKGTLAAVGAAVGVSLATATYNQAWGSQQVYTNFLALFLVSAASFMTSSAARTRRENELNQVRRIARPPRRSSYGPCRTGWAACTWRPRRARRSAAICTTWSRPGTGSG